MLTVMSCRSPARLFLLVTLPFFLILSGCDSEGSNDGAEISNEFSFTITPASSDTTTNVASKNSTKDLNGFSFFVDTEDLEDVQEQSFLIYLSGDESTSQETLAQGLFGFIGRPSTQPDEGEYTFADLQGSQSSSNFIGALYEDIQNINSAQGAPYYFVRSGTLTIQESGDDEVSGELTATATEYTIKGSGTDVQVTETAVEITGQFTARRLDAYVPVEEYTDPSGN